MTMTVVAAIGQPLQHFQEFGDIGEVEPGRRFVEDVDRLASRPAGKFEASFTRCASPPESCVAGCPRAMYPSPTSCRVCSLFRIWRDVLEEVHAFADGHLEDVGNRFALVVDLQRFAVVPLAMTDLAGHIDIRQEVHLDLDQTLARASLAAATLDVEREAARLVSACFRLRHRRVEFADRVNRPVYVAGFDRGVRPIGLWSISMTLSRCSMP